MRLSPQERQELERIASRLQSIAKSSDDHKEFDCHQEVSKLLTFAQGIKEIARRTTDREIVYTDTFNGRK